MVRAGKYGEQEDAALKEGVVTIGWKDLPDLSGVKSKEELEKLYLKTYPDAKKMQAVNEVAQLWTFISRMKKGDLVALPLKKQSAVAMGRVEDEKYEYKELAENVRHVRRVKWLKTLPRSAFDKDIIYSLGAFLTVCEIKRNDAEKRVKALLEKDTYQPGPAKPPEEGEEAIDIEQYARDEIEKYIARKLSKRKGVGPRGVSDMALENAICAP
jgi:restriction system protein